MLLSRRCAAELLGTALLLASVVGSGIMAERLAGGNVALALLANAVATGAALSALIASLGPISGAHFNPVVTLTEARRGALAWREVPSYVAAQIGGAFGGVALAHAMFELPVFVASSRERTGGAQWLAELVATFGLIVVIRGAARSAGATLPFVIGSYIAAAYWFTASTSFANPAVTLARAATDTFAGIQPADVAAFVVAQLVGGALGAWFMGWLVEQETA